MVQPKPEGADIEIIDRHPQGMTGRVLAPSAVRINGQEVLIPEDAVIQVSDISSSDFVTVTLTVFARSLSIRHEQS